MVVTPSMLGLPIKRGEDPRLVSGSGAYLEDITLPGLVHLAFARSPHAHEYRQPSASRLAKRWPERESPSQGSRPPAGRRASGCSLGQGVPPEVRLSRSG